MKSLNISLTAVRNTVIVALIAYAVASFSFNWWPFDGNQQAIKQAETTATVNEAGREAAVDAIEIVIDNSEKEKDIDEVVDTAIAAIEKADPSASAKDTRKVAVKAICQFDIYKDDPQCQVKETK